MGKNVIKISFILLFSSFLLSCEGDRNNLQDTDQVIRDAERLIERLEEESRLKLEIIDWGWRTEHGFAIAEGEVKNITAENLNDVMAVVTFRTEDGLFITSSDALIDFNPILPNQTSPFEVIVTHNPLMSRASLEFKELLGGTIRSQVAD